MERELNYLLYDLCVKWGFCIPSESIEKITKRAKYKDKDFALDVVEAEGLDQHSSWVDKIAERFRERFGTVEIDSMTFVDRIRGIKESW